MNPGTMPRRCKMSGPVNSVRAARLTRENPPAHCGLRLADVMDARDRRFGKPVSTITRVSGSKKPAEKKRVASLFDTKSHPGEPGFRKQPRVLAHSGDPQ